MVENALAIRRRHKDKAIKWGGLFVIFLILILMYVPILVLIAYSFTTATNVGTWTGFSFDLYSALFKDEEIMTALGNTIILALSSSAISVVLGTSGAIGTFYSKKRMRAAIETVTQIPVVNAEIVIAMSLTVMFVFVGTYIFMGSNIFSFWTLLIGHVILSLPFVYLSATSYCRFPSSTYRSSRSCCRWTRRSMRPRSTSAARRARPSGRSSSPR